MGRPICHRSSRCVASTVCIRLNTLCRTTPHRRILGSLHRYRLLPSRGSRCWAHLRLLAHRCHRLFRSTGPLPLGSLHRCLSVSALVVSACTFLLCYSFRHTTLRRLRSRRLWRGMPILGLPSDLSVCLEVKFCTGLLVGMAELRACSHLCSNIWCSMDTLRSSGS